MLTASDLQTAFTSLQVVADGPGAGQRVLAVHPAGGLHARVLLDRAMDIGAAWFRGEPVAWLSPTGEQPGGTDRAERWNAVWPGGLVTTCGLRNVGPPSDGYGHHGHLTDVAATEVAVRREPEAIIVTGTMREPDGLGRGLVLERTMRFAIGTAEVAISDLVRNEGAEREQTPILYHINLGYPFLQPGTETRMDARSSTPVFPHPDPFAVAMGEPAIAQSEVFEHDLGADGVELHSPATGSKLRLDWTRDTMPRFYTWRYRRPGVYVHGIEPANSGLLGREADRADGRAPYLEPGQERVTGVTLRFEELP